jgi:Outer membrane lipoprotein carrier protein LolA
MKRCASPWLCCLLLSGAAFADDVFDHPQNAAQLLKGPLAQPAAALRNAPLMRGRFVYRKYLRELPLPLTSRGEFVFARDLGIDWHTREPFDSEFVLTDKGFTQRDEGKATLQLSAAEQPTVKVVARIFLDLLSLDVNSLQRSFSLSGSQQGRQWQVGLRPTVAAIASVFREAVVSGSAQVETLVLRDANGDRTEISFTEVQYSSVVSAAERALFVNQH